MEIPDLTFQLNLTCDTDDAELARWFEQWSDLGIEWKPIGVLGATADNWIDIGYEYPDFPDKSHRTYQILVASKHKKNPSQRDLETQLTFARTLIAKFEDKGCGTDFIGYFEDYL
jgi:hypothetical protein